jgi:hypothetical protein
MTPEEQIARNHPGFGAFVAYCEVHPDLDLTDCHPDRIGYETWALAWEPFLAGWNACLIFNGLI